MSTWIAQCARMMLTVAVAAGLICGASAVAARPAPEPVVALSASGLARVDWQVETPDQAQQELQTLLQQEGSATTTAPVAPVVPAMLAARKQDTRDRRATNIALQYALSQRGRPYLWGATGPDSYDCSGLMLRSYGQAGVVLPRTSVMQAHVGTPVRVSDLKPGDLVFWAYDPSNLDTIHHVAMYLGRGMVVQAPQTGDVVKVSPLWFTGYAGAVRVAGPGESVLPNGVMLPAGVSLADGAVPPDVVPPPGGSVAGDTPADPVVPGLNATTAPAYGHDPILSLPSVTPTAPSTGPSPTTPATTPASAPTTDAPAPDPTTPGATTGNATPGTTQGSATPGSATSTPADAPSSAEPAHSSAPDPTEKAPTAPASDSPLASAAPSTS